MISTDVFQVGFLSLLTIVNEGLLLTIVNETIVNYRFEKRSFKKNENVNFPI